LQVHRRCTSAPMHGYQEVQRRCTSCMPAVHHMCEFEARRATHSHSRCTFWRHRASGANRGAGRGSPGRRYAGVKPASTRGFSKLTGPRNGPVATISVYFRSKSARNGPFRPFPAMAPASREAPGMGTERMHSHAPHAHACTPETTPMVWVVACTPSMNTTMMCELTHMTSSGVVYCVYGRAGGQDQECLWEVWCCYADVDGGRWCCYTVPITYNVGVLSVCMLCLCARLCASGACTGCSPLAAVRAPGTPPIWLQA
jgi:hypothetical protein